MDISELIEFASDSNADVFNFEIIKTGEGYQYRFYMKIGKWVQATYYSIEQLKHLKVPLKVLLKDSFKDILSRK